MQPEKAKCSLDHTEMIKLQEVVAKHKDMEGALIPVLHEAQQIFGYLPLEVQLEISKGLGISLAEIYGVVSFYTQFFIYPKGSYKINVCMGTACYVKGAGEILDKFKERLGIGVGECTEDGKFSLESCRCIGACGLAPVVTINDKVYGKLTADLVDGILNEYKNGAGMGEEEDVE
jgi:NADP-reducing hydrogenase subunit HndA